jgi:hypothetical protein
MGVLARLFGHRAVTRKTTAANPLLVKDPAIGFLNLQGSSGAGIAESDMRILSPLFTRTEASITAPPQCTVLFIYATLDKFGNVQGHTVRIRDLAKEAGAYVVVVASDNAPQCYTEALGPKRDWHANFTMTLNRKGDGLALYFRRLFQEMFSGTSMLLAWVKLSPQIPGREDPDSPGMFMAAEAGHIVFTSSR